MAVQPAAAQQLLQGRGLDPRRRHDDEIEPGDEIHEIGDTQAAREVLDRVERWRSSYRVATTGPKG